MKVIFSKSTTGLGVTLMTVLLIGINSKQKDPHFPKLKNELVGLPMESGIWAQVTTGLNY